MYKGFWHDRYSMKCEAERPERKEIEVRAERFLKSRRRREVIVETAPVFILAGLLWWFVWAI